MEAKYIYPKDFIRNVLIEELKDIVFKHAYLSFALIAVGIEYIGKCNMTTRQDWHNINPSNAFDEGLNLLSSNDQRYADENLNLKDSLRNGFAHTLSPKSKIGLSEIKHGTEHFKPASDGKITMVVEYLFADFVKVCNIILDKEFPENDKMNKPILEIK